MRTSQPTGRWNKIHNREMDFNQENSISVNLPESVNGSLGSGWRRKKRKGEQRRRAAGLTLNSFDREERTDSREREGNMRDNHLSAGHHRFGVSLDWTGVVPLHVVAILAGVIRMRESVLRRGVGVVQMVATLEGVAQDPHRRGISVWNRRVLFVISTEKGAHPGISQSCVAVCPKRGVG